MGSVYRKVEPRKQKGRYIYNRNRLHKVGWEPKHKKKHIELLKAMCEQINELHLTTHQPIAPFITISVNGRREVVDL